MSPNLGGSTAQRLPHLHSHSRGRRRLGHDYDESLSMITVRSGETRVYWSRLRQRGGRIGNEKVCDEKKHFKIIIEISPDLEETNEILEARREGNNSDSSIVPRIGWYRWRFVAKMREARENLISCNGVKLISVIRSPQIVAQMEGSKPLLERTSCESIRRKFITSETWSSGTVAR